MTRFFSPAAIALALILSTAWADEAEPPPDSDSAPAAHTSGESALETAPSPGSDGAPAGAPTRQGTHWSRSDPKLPAAVSTAYRYEQTWVGISAASTVLPAQRVAELQISSLSDIAAQTPWLSFSPFSPGRNILTMRGVNAGDGAAEDNNSVAFFLNGLYLSQTPNIHFEPAELERVEVLRGPSHILHGKDAIGGIVNVVLRKPDLRVRHGRVVLAAGDGLYRLSGYYSSPLTAGQSGVSISGLISTKDGFFDGTADGGRGFSNAQLRNHFRYQSGGHSVFTTLLLSAVSDYNPVRGGVNAGAGQIADIGSTDDPARSFFDTLSGIRVSGFDSLGVILGAEYTRLFSERISLDYIAGVDIAVNSWKMDLEHAVSAPLGEDISEVSEHISQELRLRLDYPRWDSIVGLSYWLDNIYREEDPFPHQEGGAFADLEIFRYSQETESSSFAFFAQTEVSLGRGVYLLFGARYSREKKILGLGLDGDIFDFIPFNSGTVRWAVTTPKIALGFRAGHSHHLYLAYSRGLDTSPRQSFIGDEQLLRLNSFRQELAASLELTYKAEFSPRARLGLSLFQSNYENLTHQVFHPEAFLDFNWVGFGFFEIMEIPKATILGAELELQYKPSVYFLMELALAYNTSQYRDSRVETLFDARPILRSPVFRYTLRLSGDVPIDDEYSFHWLVDYRASDKMAYFFTAPEVLAPAYHLVDLRLTWRFPRRWELALWLRNLTDEIWVQNAYLIGSNPVEIFGLRREFSAVLTWRF